MAGKHTRDFIKKLIKNDILLAKNQTPDIGKILAKLDKFEDDIEKSVLAGEDKYIKKKDINLKFTSCKVKISDRLPYRALLNDLEQGLIDLAVVEYEELLNEQRKQKE